MKLKIVYFGVGLYLLFVISTIFFRLPISDQQIEGLIKITPAVFSAGAFLVALSLYDRYGLKKFSYEKKIETVLKYIETLQSIEFTYYLIHPEMSKRTEIITQANIYPSTKMIGSKIMTKEFKDLPVLIYSENITQELLKIYPHFKNLFLPKQIKGFPFRPFSHKTVSNIPQNYVLIIMGGKKRSEYINSELCSLNDKNINIHEFIGSIENKMKSIQIWIDKETQLGNHFDF